MVQSTGNSVSPSSEHLVGASVIDAEGNTATIDAIQQGGGDSSTGPQAWIRVQDGTRVLVPVSLLAAQEEGTYRLPFVVHVPGKPGQAVQMSFPVMEEQAHISKRVIDTGRGVRIHKTVSEREQVLDQPLQHDRLEIERVPVGRVVAESDLPQTRYEGDTLVVPILEEVLVVQKQLLLKEEVRVTRHREEVRRPQTVVLRAEQVQVERFEEGRKQ